MSEPVSELPNCPQCNAAVDEVRYGNYPHNLRLALLPEVTGSVEPSEFRLQPCTHLVGGYLTRDYKVQRWTEPMLHTGRRMV